MGRSARAHVGAHARIAFRRAPRTPPEITRENFSKKTALLVARAQKNQAFKKPSFSARPEPKYPRRVFAPIFAENELPPQQGNGLPVCSNYPLMFTLTTSLFT